MKKEGSLQKRRKYDATFKEEVLKMVQNGLVPHNYQQQNDSVGAGYFTPATPILHNPHYQTS